MKKITSRDNPMFKLCRELNSSAQQRRKHLKTLLDGIHLCQSYLEQGGLPEACVMVKRSLEKPEVQALVAACELHGLDCIELSDKLYREITQLEMGVGIIFVVAIPSLVAPIALCESAILLDRLQDPGNLGSILRSAAAAGVGAVFLSEETVSAWSPKVLRAGMGAHFLLRIYENVDLQLIINEAQIPVLATSSHGVRTLYEVDLHKPVAWLFGNEGQGIDPMLQLLANELLKIPQLGTIESMNVAASVAVCLFESQRQAHFEKESVDKIAPKSVVL